MEKRGPKRTKEQALLDRATITDLYLKKGLTQQEIATVLNAAPGRPYTLTQQQVSRDIVLLREEWRKAAARDIDEMQHQEIRRLELVERAAWEGWEGSQQDGTKTTQFIGAQGKETGEAERVTIETIERCGDPRYLAEVNRCIAQRCKILGLNAPDLITTPPGQPMQHEYDFSALSTEQLTSVRDLLLAAQSGPRRTE